MIINSEHLTNPTSFRTDIFQTTSNLLKAYEDAQMTIESQLGRVEPLSMSAEVTEV